MDKISLLEGLGYIAGFLTTFANIPQIIKAWKTKSVKDLSIIMYIMSSSGVFMWMAYGYLKGADSLFFWNIVTLCMTSTLLIMKIVWSKPSSSNT